MLYQKGFIERIINRKNLIIENKTFNKEYGIYTSNNTLATKLFNERKVKEIFLTNNLLILNTQKENHTIVIKNMGIKIYKITEF